MLFSLKSVLPLTLGLVGCRKPRKPWRRTLTGWVRMEDWYASLLDGQHWYLYSIPDNTHVWEFHARWEELYWDLLPLLFNILTISLLCHSFYFVRFFEAFCSRYFKCWVNSARRHYHTTNLFCLVLTAIAWIDLYIDIYDASWAWDLRVGSGYIQKALSTYRRTQCY